MAFDGARRPVDSSHPRHHHHHHHHHGVVTRLTSEVRPSAFAQTVWADLSGLAKLKGARLTRPGGLIDVLMLPGTLSVLLFRLSCVFHETGLRPISRLLYILNLVLFGADLSPGAQVGPGLVIPHPVGVGFTKEARIGRDVHLVMGAALGGGRDWSEEAAKDGFPTIGDGCWIAAGAKVLGPVEIGAHALIGPNALVMRHVPAGGIAFGNPARVIGYRHGFEPPRPPERPAPKFQADAE